MLEFRSLFRVFVYSKCFTTWTNSEKYEINFKIYYKKCQSVFFFRYTDLEVKDRLFPFLVEENNSPKGVMFLQWLCNYLFFFFFYFSAKRSISVIFFLFLLSCELHPQKFQLGFQSQLPPPTLISLCSFVFDIFSKPENTELLFSDSNEKNR